MQLGVLTPIMRAHGVDLPADLTAGLASGTYFIRLTADREFSAQQQAVSSFRIVR